MNIRTIQAAACTLLLAASGSVASAEEAQWQHTLVFYGMGAAIDGESQIGDLTVPVDVSISEVFDALEFGAMGAYRADNGTWSFTVDATYMGLGGTSEDLSTDLKVTTTAPVTGAVTVRTASVDASWVDPMLGLHYGRPFADEWRFNLRGDVGGFGIGSDFSYQVFANVHWQSSGGFGAVLGYRLIGFDHEDGRKGSPGYQRFDLTEQGPLLGITYTF